MTARRKKLPLPCPKCGKDSGTVQFIKFRGSNTTVCRIGHYAYGIYTNRFGELKKQFLAWCSFRTGWRIHKLEEWYDHRSWNDRRKSKSCGLDPTTWIRIRHHDGWQEYNSRGPYLKVLDRSS